jgi:hypothetical protein
MKYVQHAKTFKPESLEGHELIKGHTHSHVTINPTSAEAIEELKKAVAKADISTVPLFAGNHLVHGIEPGDDAFIGGPVYMGGGQLKHTDVIHPHDISVSLAMDALKYHGILFKNISMNYQPMQDVSIVAEMCAVGPEAQNSVMEMHSWMYEPGKGY